MITTTIISAILGISGSIASNILAYKTKKLDIKVREIDNLHELAKMEKESDLMIREIEANIKIVETEFEGKADLAEAEAFLKSKKNDKNLLDQKYLNKLFDIKGKMSIFAQPIGMFLIVLFGLVDVIRKLIRPGVVIFLAGITFWLAVKTYIIGGNILAVKAGTIFMLIVEIILQLFTIAISWYFSSRQISKAITADIREKIKK